MDIFESLENLNVSEECFNDIVGLVEGCLSESNPETIQKVANKRAYDAGRAGSLQFNYGLKTQKGEKALDKFVKLKDLIRKREKRTGDWAVKHNEVADSHDKGWEDAKDVMEK